MVTGEEIAAFGRPVKRGHFKYLQLQEFPEVF